MLQAGINVEPFSMIDWSHLIFDRHATYNNDEATNQAQEETFCQQVKNLGKIQPMFHGIIIDCNHFNRHVSPGKRARWTTMSAKRKNT